MIDISDIKDFFVGAIVIITLDQVNSDLAEKIFEYLKLIVLYIGGIGLFCSLLFCIPIFSILNIFPLNIFTNIIVINKVIEIIKSTIKDTHVIPSELLNIINILFDYIPLTTINNIFKFPYDMIDKFIPTDIIDNLSTTISTFLDKGNDVVILSYIVDLIKYLYNIFKIVFFEPVTLQNEDIILYILIVITGIL